MAKGSFDLRAWARIGAQQRLRELNDERDNILEAFPELGGGAENPVPASSSNGGDTEVREVAAARRPTHDTATQPRKRRKLSAEARRRISEAQKARWAKQKKAGS